MYKFKVLKVQGYTNHDNSFDFATKDSWNGYVILRKDLTFEGIVNDTNSETKDRLISGTLAQYNGASFMKFGNDGMCPCSFSGASIGNIVLGTWSSTDLCSSTYVGKCKLIFEEVSVDDTTINNLEKRIKSFKLDMDCFSKRLYDSFVDNISSTVKYFLQNLDLSRRSIEYELGASLQKLNF